jgi:hypothetical protein
MSTKKPSKKNGKATNAGETSKAMHLALESLAETLDCRACVIRTIEQQCNTTIGSLGDKLRDVCSPCDTGAMADLADALRRNCGAREDLQLSCSMTIIQVIHAVCG